jgi:hypothetical protein
MNCYLKILLISGCSFTKSSLYPGTSQTPDLKENGVEALGEVTACQGAFYKKEEGGYEWPIGLSHPPTGLTYQRAIQKKAAKQYSVPEEQIVVGEIAVGYHAEMIGTIRKWEATAPIKKTKGSAMSFVKINEYILNPKAIQYAKEHGARDMMLYFSGVEPVKVTREEWEGILRTMGHGN